MQRVIEKNNVHKHTCTCYKYGSCDCRFKFPRPVVELSHIDENGVIFLRRRPGNECVNNYNDITSSLVRSNMDIKLLSNGQDSKALSFYITDYITKQAMKSHNAFPVILAAVETLESAMYPMQNDPMLTPAQQASRNLIVRCLNKLTTHNEKSGQEVSTILLGLPLHYTSHTFKKIYLGACMWPFK